MFCVRWLTVKTEATRRIATAGRLTGVNALGVDEHVWSHTGPPGTGMVTGIVDHTRDAHGVVHAKFLELVPGPLREGLTVLQRMSRTSSVAFVSAATPPFSSR